MVENIAVDGFAHDIAISKQGKVYIAKAEGLYMLDTSNPKKVEKFDGYICATGVSISKDGKLAYIANFTKGLLILDINNTGTYTRYGLVENKITAIKKISKPKRVSSLKVGIGLFNVAISKTEKLAYGVGCDGLSVIDISDTTNTIIIGSKRTIYTANSVALSKDEKIAYVTTINNNIAVLDISDKRDIKEIKEIEISNTPLCIALSSDGKLAYIVEGGDTIIIFDIVDNCFAEIAKYTLHDIDIYSIALSADDTKAYLAGGDNGIYIIDTDVIRGELL